MALRVFGDAPLAFTGHLSSPYLFIDMRVYLPRLMADFQERGGKIVFGPVGVDDVTALSASHETLSPEDDPAALSAAVLAVLKAYAPDTYARVNPAKCALTGPLSWLSGAVTPIARRGWAPLAGGKLAMAVGDAHITHDPITGQGANGASRGAFTLAELVEAQARAGGRFDEAFCVDAEQKLWDDSRAVTEWSNAFLQPPPPHAIGLLVAAAQNQAIANAFADNFNTPKQQWAVL